MRYLRIIGSALALTAAGAIGAVAQDREKCYGVAQAGKNDGIGQAEQAGGATVNFQGNAWVWLPTGRCLTISLPPRADGTPRRGSLEPLDRDTP